MSAGGCGGGCRCAGDAPEIKNDTECAVPGEPLMLDANGKCPCGKSVEDCCHKDELSSSEHNHALDELCEAPGNESPCGGDK
ncbi:MAG: hypothetical protein A2494_03870 [Candidatus Lloydbacteria bacterium RIFOXYC12_FULL_46_25]|uniref:Uncharacterized protein n=1 Tax=Candidatus Lloydbacteria bacterium RIFOXYC12_FULL_46_25 TaxID=1798670 RepID=A0A1G2DZR5_9BACT|nr:MAG: hypothetical protein A2494_03870 [Candidatus Lloydbacteria bacterium RIFOXYC12_FULL_46_25]